MTGFAPQTTKAKAAPPAALIAHICRVCGGPASFGFGVSVRTGREGRWSCLPHRTEVERMVS